MENIKTKEELTQLIESNPNELMVLDFYAEWCGPCKLLGVNIDNIHAEQKDFMLLKVNIEEAEELTNEFHIRNVPTLIFMKDGLIIDKSIGAIGKDSLIEKININKDK